MSAPSGFLAAPGLAVAPKPALRIEVLRCLAPDDVPVCWAMYQTAFEPLRARAATRHVMYEDEFAAAMADPRLDKLVGFDRHDRPVGMALVTKDLRAIPWISPEFFASRYPEETARGAVTYIGFVLIDPGQQRGTLFHKLIQHMSAPIVAESGVVAFDMCTFNASVVKLPDAILRAIRRRSRADDRVEDVQTFYALHLSARDA